MFSSKPPLTIFSFTKIKKKGREFDEEEQNWWTKVSSSTSSSSIFSIFLFVFWCLFFQSQTNPDLLFVCFFSPYYLQKKKEKIFNVMFLFCFLNKGKLFQILYGYGSLYLDLLSSINIPLGGIIFQVSVTHIRSQ